MKVCNSCKRELPLARFGHASGNKDGRQRWCGWCMALYDARRRAKRLGVPFGLTVTNLPWPEPGVCPVLGIPLIRGAPEHKANSPSLDRIVPALGYVPGNVRWISFRANHIKYNATAAELELIVQDIHRLRGEGHDV